MSAKPRVQLSLEPVAASLEAADLPYVVELWDETQTTVAGVLAGAADATLGFAAFYAALREYPARYITLRQAGNLITAANAAD
jgi:hypothetical protein